MPGAPVGGRPGGAARVLLFMHLGIRAGASARATSPTTPRATELRATRAPEVASRGVHEVSAREASLTVTVTR